ncbi:hypothetical protein [Piscirickettsia litoralis]|uniref:hypothetical protein n=1 Tax=Piscirickettsia litoralis TaxID=1891921 RepID=UPI0013014E53|nr:hypothetical protein [Piscirickettsia litoralis]
MPFIRGGHNFYTDQGFRNAVLDHAGKQGLFEIPAFMIDANIYLNGGYNFPKKNEFSQ